MELRPRLHRRYEIRRPQGGPRSLEGTFDPRMRPAICRTRSAQNWRRGGVLGKFQNFEKKWPKNATKVDFWGPFENIRKKFS